MQDIELHIDEIILHGFAPHDLEGIKQAISAELSHLIMKNGIPPLLSSGHNLQKIDAGEIKLEKGTRSGLIGKEIAGSVFNGLNPTKSRIKK